MVKDGSNRYAINPRIPNMLDLMVAHFGKMPTINSAYRSPEYNRKVGGAKGSQHLYGNAVDLSFPGISPKVVAAYARKLGFTGIGLYKNFVHVDLGPRRSWFG